MNSTRTNSILHTAEMHSSCRWAHREGGYGTSANCQQIALSLSFCVILLRSYCSISIIVLNKKNNSCQFYVVFVVVIQSILVLSYSHNVWMTDYKNDSTIVEIEYHFRRALDWKIHCYANRSLLQSKAIFKHSQSFR